MKARVLVVDPPWLFGDPLPGKNRGASKNYACLTVEQLCAFELPPTEPDAFLFLWRVSSQVEEAYRVLRAWGWVPKTEIVWKKKTVRGMRHFGMGRIVRAEHETCIVATRGRPQRKVANIRSVIEAPVGAHSAKPEAFYDLVEALAPGPYFDVFARRKRPGWTCVGDEAPALDPSFRPRAPRNSVDIPNQVADLRNTVEKG